MRPKLTEMELMKFWIDSEFSILHAMIAFVVTFHTSAWWQDALLWFYIFYSVIYAAVRIGAVASQKRDFLRLPPVDPDIVPRPGDR